MASSTAPTTAGAFVQLIEYRTDRPSEVEDIIEHWTSAIGAKRTARWYLIAADRDKPGVFLQLVEFPSQAAAASNSDHPATAEFAAALAKISEGEIVYRNLDVVAANTF